MKKITVLMIVFLLFAGCSAESADSKKSTETIAIANITQKNTDNITADETIAAVPTAETKESLSGWQQAYREELYNYIASDKYDADKSAFSIYDINGDDIPELFVSGRNDHASGTAVYTYTDKLVNLGEYGSWGKMLFYPNKKTLFGGYSGQGTNHSAYYRLNKENTLLKLAQFYDNSGTVHEQVYKIDDIEVTEEEYNAAEDQYFDPYNRIELGGDLKLTKEIVDGTFSGASDWKECYKQFLCGLITTADDFSQFSLYDVTDDGIPELFISMGTRHPSPCYIYTFKNGLVYIDKLGTYGDLGYSPNQKLFTSSNLSQGYYSLGYYKLDENLILQHEIYLFTNYNAVPKEERIYEIDHESVSFDEFKTTYEEYHSIKDFIGMGRDHELTMEDIRKAFS